MENEFPPNSYTKKEARHKRDDREESDSDKKEVVRVTRGKTIQRKKPLRKKFLEAFRPEDGRGFVEYTLLEVLVPGVKDAVADASTTAIENALGVGDHRSARRRGRGRGSYTSYSGMSSSRPRSRRERERDRDDDRDRDRPSRRSSPRMESEHREIVLETRVEAEEVLDNLYELMSKYETATRRDLLSMVGEPWEFTDEDWGWTELRGARVHKVREGYLLDLPRPEPLD